MNNWKILLIGITGDLAKRKILPAIGQFASIHIDDLNIELMGYSRSVPDDEEIKRSLNAKVPNSTEIIENINYYQGEYDDDTLIKKVFNELKKEERLIVYFAVPPIVFCDLLKNFCPFARDNLNIIIEKPFGRDLDEARKIIKKIEECNLEKNVHFFDHYLFKDGMDITEAIRESMKIVQTKKICISALETVGVNGRAGYYDETGAIKDMLPSHLFALYRKVEELHSNIRLEDFSVENIVKKQYEAYKADVGKESNTETYFKIEMKNKNGVELVFESGKKQDKKVTEIVINEGEIVWNIDTDKNVRIGSKLFSLATDDLLDHTRMFQVLKKKEYSNFVSNEDTVRGWELWERVGASTSP